VSVSRGKTLIGTEVVLIVGLVAFVGAMAGLDNASGKGTPVNMGPLVALCFVLVPAILWLGYFYLQDRHEPEPKHLVGGMFLLGFFVASPVAGFLLEHVVPVAPSKGLDPLSPDRFMKSILLIGMAQELAKYLVVRYTIYGHHEFDEPMDGIIYTMAVGLGFATAVNFNHLTGLEGGKMLLTSGAVRIVVNTLAAACFAGVLGYAMGRARFGAKSPGSRGGILAAGLVVAAVLNGVFHVLESRVALASGVNPDTVWRSLAVAAGFAGVVFLGVSLLMRRHLAASPHKA
jgi:protease PrsW